MISHTVKKSSQISNYKKKLPKPVREDTFKIIRKGKAVTEVKIPVYIDEDLGFKNDTSVIDAECDDDVETDDEIIRCGKLSC